MRVPAPRGRPSREQPSGAVGLTVSAANYLPYVRVLAQGWRRHHGDMPLHVLVLDADTAPDLGDGLSAFTPADLPIDAAELARLRGIYAVAELSTALKPMALRHLLDAGAAVVMHVDADCDLHAHLGDAVGAATTHGIVLTPHQLDPLPGDGRSPDAFEVSRNGIFNSGFLAVGPSGRPFLDWWADLVARDCLFSEPLPAHADQLWLEFVPAYFDHHVWRDRGVNVAQWNVHERRIGWDGGAYTVDGGPLRSFHFAGFDPDSPDAPSTYYWPSPLRFEMAHEPALRRLCHEYAERLFAAGLAEAREAPYRHAVSAGGTALSMRHRRIYRELVIAAQARGVDVPDPFDAARADEFERMLADPGATGLLSAAARARLLDLHLSDAVINHGGLRLRSGLARPFAYWLQHRAALRRHPWSPRPLPSTRTRLEYL